MILRTYLVLLACWLTGNSADGMYFKYKLSPNNAELTIATVPRTEHVRYGRDAGHWMHRNRKKLVVLDRKNKFVAAFIQKLIKLIEKEKNVEKPKPISKMSNAEKIPCYRSFFNSRFRKCTPSVQATTKPILKLMTVNVIPIQSENVFVDSTRQGSDGEFDSLTSSDTDSFTDMSDYTDDYDVERRAKIVQNSRRHGHPLYIDRADSSDDSSNTEDVVQPGKKSKRFEIVTNGNVKHKEHQNEINVNSQGDSDRDVRQEESDSDQEKVLQAPTYTAKTVKALDTDEDSDMVLSDNDASEVDDWKRKKQKIKPKVIKKPKYSGELSSLEDVSKEKPSKKKKQSNNYVYLQGAQPVNSDMETDDDARRDGMNRLQDFFMPKRNIWDSSEIHHLSYYWFNGPQGHVLYS